MRRIQLSDPPSLRLADTLVPKRNSSEPRAQLLARSLPHPSDGNEPSSPALRSLVTGQPSLETARSSAKGRLSAVKVARASNIGRGLVTGAKLCDSLRRGWTGKRLDGAGLVLFDIEDCRQPCHLQQIMHPLAQIHELEFAPLVANGGMSLY